MTKVLDHGSVVLEDSMGDDLSVVNSARVSFAKQSMLMTEADERLIGFLMKGRHGTPFEHNSFKFRVKAPIFVMREWIRHRIGSFNEWSGRYSELEPVWYVPEPESVRSQVGKPGAYTFEPMEEKDAGLARLLIDSSAQDSYAAYKGMLGFGVAKEVARMVLPLSIYTEFIWTVNARSLMNFLSLRNSEHAQLEIRKYAEAVEDYWAIEMPLTHRVFEENGRIAP